MGRLRAPPGHRAGTKQRRSTGEGGRRADSGLTEAHLYCADNGAPLDKEGARALLFSHLSPKRDTAEIGRFGVGFKSVLRITDSPAVFSRSGSVQFDRVRAKQRIEQVAPKAEQYPVLRVAEAIDPRGAADADAGLRDLMDWAVNVVRLPLKPGAYEDLRDQLESFRAEFLLFVPHVQQLDLSWRDGDGGGSERAVRLVESGGEFELSDGLEVSHWVVFEREHQLSDEARADSRALDDAEGVRIAWAAPRMPRGAGQEFWAYFPTQSSSLLAGILNAPWKTNEDRQNLLPGPYNDELVDAAASLVVDNLHHLRSDDQPAQHLDYLPRRQEFGDAEHADRLRRSIYRRLETSAVIPNQAGDLQRFAEVHVPPEALTPGQRVESEIVRLWSSYRHKPSDWLHDDALANDRLSAIARVGDGGRTTRGNLMRTSVAQWLGALVRSGAEHRDSVDASATAIVIAGMMRKMVGDGALFGGIVLTNSGEWAQPIPDQLYLGVDQAAGSANTVHAELMSRPDVEQTLLTLGIRPPSAESAFQGLVTALFSAARSEEQWKDFWRLSREVDQNFATRLVRGSTGWCQKVRALALDGEWRPISMLLLPGPIVPADRSRDATVAIDTEFHLQDLAFFRHLGVASAPRAVQASDHTPPMLIDFRDRCFNEYRKFVRPQRPRNHLLSIYSNQDVEPLDAFAALSDTGRVAFTEAVLDLPATYDRWEVAHKHRDRYPVMAVKFICGCGARAARFSPHR